MTVTRAKVRTTCTDPIYNSGRKFISAGILTASGQLICDGNWRAEDNDLYNYLPEDALEVEVLEPGDFEIIDTWRARI